MGTSGAGKGTLIHHLGKTYKDLFSFSVSCTTRAPRKGEVEGKDYYFVSHEEFDKMIQDKAFAEWASVHTNKYGTLKKELERIKSEKKIPILDIDIQGAT